MWSFFENYFTPEECKILTLKCLNMGLKEGFQQATIGGGGRLDTGYRRCRLVSIDYDVMPTIFDKFVDAVSGANREWFGNLDINRLGYVQFMEYDVDTGGYYKEHGDVIYLDPANDESEAIDLTPVTEHRKISFTLQLTDSSEYEGCDLELNESDYETTGPLPHDKIREQGTLVVFPSFVRHKITPITKGIRYSIVGWVTGPNWR